MENDTSNVLMDDYTEEGTDILTFREAIKLFGARTAYVTVYPSNLTLFSYKDSKRLTLDDNTIKEKHEFYIIDRQALNDIRNRNEQFRVATFTAETGDEEKKAAGTMMKSITQSSGLILMHQDERGKENFYGISKHAMSTLCAQAGVKGARLHEASLFRDCYIAEGLFGNTENDASVKEVRRSEKLMGDGITLVIRKRLYINSNNRKVRSGMGMVFAALSGSYTPFDQAIILKVFDRIKKSRPLGATVMKKWHIDQQMMAVSIEFPDKADALAKKYNLKTRLIPGMIIVTSDCGISSFAVRGTMRIESSNPDEEKKAKTDKTDNNYIIIAETGKKHQGEPPDEQDIYQSLKKDIFPEFEKYVKKYAAVKDTVLSVEETKQNDETDEEKANTPTYKLLRDAGIVSCLGKKRTVGIAQVLKNRVGGGMNEVTIEDYFKEVLQIVSPFNIKGTGEEDVLYARNTEYINSETIRLHAGLGEIPFLLHEKEAKKGGKKS